MAEKWSRRLLAGWGRASPSCADVLEVQSEVEVESAVADAVVSGRRILARGLGRSYGDAAQSGGGIVLRMTNLASAIEFDGATGRLRVEAGASLDYLMRTFLPQGWFVPVTPGTRYITVGGAIAADVHGKNHHVDGSFCSFVRSMRLIGPSGAVECGPGGGDDGLFWATAGGMGLTGVITAATVDLLPVETSYVVVDTERATDLDDCMDRMSSGDDSYRYSVAWIDCLARGRSLGRSVLTRGNHARLADLPSGMAGDPFAFGPRARIRVPFAPPVAVLRPGAISAFNATWYRKAPRRRSGSIETIPHFFHPLDGIGGWNLLYGARGFTQYQFVVPLAATDTVRRVLERLSRARAASFLAVLKRFGIGDPGPLSFPMPGWTLALDLPLGTPGLAQLLDGLDELVAAAAGRVYLAKDGRLRRELLPAMYPRLDEWRSQRLLADPEGLFVSDLGRRLGLCGYPDRLPADAPRRRAIA